MKERIRVMIRKEFVQALREPRLRAMLVLPPLVQLLIFGFAVSLDLENAAIGWMDGDDSPASHELLAAFQGSVHFRVASWPRSEDQMQSLLDRGEVLAVVRVNQGFARDLARGRTASVQILVDGSNSNDAQILSGYASRVVSEFGARLAPARAAPAVQAATRVWFNPSLESRKYFVPGVILNIVLIMTLMLTAMAIVREKEIGTMEQLMVTPIRPMELILGKTLPFIAIGLFDMALVTIGAITVFGIPFQGSSVLLVGCTLLFLMTTLGTGLFISTISHTQQQAMMSSFFFFLPALMLSGFTFPVQNMPRAVELLSRVNPLRHFLEIIRGIMLKGASADSLWPQMAALAVIGVLVLGASVLRFQKRLE